MKHLFTLIAAALFFGLYAADKTTSTVPGKICILVTDVGTIDTVAKTEEFLTKIKQFNIENTPTVSAADKAADPTIAKKEINFRFQSNVEQYNEQQREIARQNRRMEQILDNLRTSVIGDKTKRDIVVAKQYLQSYLAPYADFIQVIDRSNTSLSEVEKVLNGNDQQNLASACVFLTLIMQDLKEESNTVSVGNTMVKRTTYTQKAVGNLRDFNGNVLTAFNVVAKSSRRQTSASNSSGFNPSSDMMEEVLKQVAEKVAAYYLTSVEVKCIAPKGVEDFDEDAVTFTIDGKDFENGEKVLAGKHFLTAEAEGFAPVKRQITVRGNRDKNVIKIRLKKAAAAAPAAAPAAAN